MCSAASGGKPEDGEDDVMIQSISRQVMEQFLGDSTYSFAPGATGVTLRFSLHSDRSRDEA
jgi:hypothetical protein